MATLQMEEDDQPIHPPPETDVWAAKPAASSKPKWYRMVLTVLGLLTLIGKAILVDCQAAQALAEVWRHLHHFGF